MDLPVWQALYEELGDKGFVPFAVALDSGGEAAARRWIEAAHPTYPCVIDRHHRVAELYGMVNVPTAVWIDEDGRIVRGPETAGTSDAWRAMEAGTYRLPPEAAEELRTHRAVYRDALRDWVEHGPASVHVLAPAEARRRMPGSSTEEALAATYFRLGLYLHERGRPQDAQQWFGRAKELAPDNWAYARQAWDLEAPGKAGGPEFFAAVRALGERRYYPPIDMAGMPQRGRARE